jgi:hypothetical protein
MTKPGTPAHPQRLVNRDANGMAVPLARIDDRLEVRQVPCRRALRPRRAQSAAAIEVPGADSPGQEPWRDSRVSFRA